MLARRGDEMYREHRGDSGSGGNYRGERELNTQRNGQMGTKNQQSSKKLEAGSRCVCSEDGGDAARECTW